MAIPSVITSGRVTGRYGIGFTDGPDEDEEPEILAATGSTFTFRPDVPGPLLYETPDGQALTMALGEFTAVVDSDGFLCTPVDPKANPLVPGRPGIRLPAHDTPGLRTTGWTWTVTPRMVTPAGTVLVGPTAPKAFSFLLAGGAEVDLTKVAKAPASTGISVDAAVARAAAAEALAGQALAAVQELGENGLPGSPVNLVVLNDTEPVPVGTRAGTLIVRTSGAASTPVDPEPSDPDPEPVTLAAVPEGATRAGTLNDTSLSLTRPAGTTSGDLLVCVFHRQNAGSTFTLPPGWEMLAYKSTETALRSTMVATHRVTAESPSAWTFVSSASARGTAVMFRVTGAAASGDLATGLSPEAVQGVQSAVAGGFTLSARSLVLVVAHAQVTTANPWPLPSSITPSGFTRIVEAGNDEANKATATQSVVSVYAGVMDAGTAPETTVQFAHPVAATAALAVGIRGA